jgi:predicted ATP-dependent serine protease
MQQSSAAVQRQMLLQQAMANAGLHAIYANLGKHSIKESGHVMEQGVVDIMQLGMASQQQAEQVLRIAAAQLTPRCVPLTSRMQSEHKSRLQLGIPDIDTALGGGLLSASITELVGPAGAIA